MLIDRQVGSGSPQRSQIGGVMGWIDRQQARHTGPSVGCSRSCPHAAQPGANTTLSVASTASRSTSVQAISLPFLPERLSTDAEQARGVGLVATDVAQRRRDVSTLD